CSAFLAIALTLHVVVIAWVVYVNPFRFVHGTPLFFASTSLNAVLLLLMVVSLLLPRDAVFGIMVLQLAVCALRMALMLCGLGLESRLESIPTRRIWTTGVVARSAIAQHPGLERGLLCLEELMFEDSCSRTPDGFSQRNASPVAETSGWSTLPIETQHEPPLELDADYVEMADIIVDEINHCGELSK
ncbi:membrane-associated protein, putative, partial [Bodo saltans]